MSRDLFSTPEFSEILSELLTRLGAPTTASVSRSKSKIIAADTVSAIYRHRVIKRIRRTKSDMAAICDAICAEFEAHHPQTIRHVFYRLTVNGVIPKTAAAYNTVKRKSLDLRKDGVLPFAWVADNTRWIRRPTTYDSPEEAALACARDYRRALWRHSGVHVEVWSESDSIAGTIVDITDD